MASERPGWRRLALLSLVLAAAIAVQAHAVLVEKAGLASNPPRGAEAWSPEVEGGVSLAQTFLVSAGDFHGVTVYPRAAGGAVAGDAVFELAVVEGEASETLVRVMRPAGDVVRREAFVLEFPPVARPAGRVFRLTISVPTASPGEGLSFRLVEEDRYADGVASVDGRELWGDLAFETHARKAVLINRLDEAFRAYPAWMRAPWLLGGLLLLFDALVAWAAWLALCGPRVARPASEATPAADVARPRWPTPLALAGTVVVVVAISALAWPREHVAIDLVRAFPAAEKRTTMSGLHEGFSIQFAAIDGRMRRCIQALPFSRINFAVDVPPNAAFAVWVGMRPDVWEGPGDGATFRIGFADGTNYDEPYRRHFFPLEHEADRVLAPVRFDLSRYAGQRIEVVLNTEPSFNAVGDAALWCEPRVVRR